MTYASKSGGSTGYAKPGKTTQGAAGAKVGGKPMGMRQDFKRTGEVQGLKASGTTNNANAAPVAPTGGRKLHEGNPYD